MLKRKRKNKRNWYGEDYGASSLYRDALREKETREKRKKKFENVMSYIGRWWWWWWWWTI